MHIKGTRKSSEYTQWIIQDATHCNTLQHTATHCNTLHLNPKPNESYKTQELAHATPSVSVAIAHPMHHTIRNSSCNTQYLSCNSQYLSCLFHQLLQHMTKHCSTLLHTATHYNTLHALIQHPTSQSRVPSTVLCPISYCVCPMRHCVCFWSAHLMFCLHINIVCCLNFWWPSQNSKRKRGELQNMQQVARSS